MRKGLFTPVMEVSCGAPMGLFVTTRSKIRPGGGDSVQLRIGIRTWGLGLREQRKKSPGCAKAFSVPGTGLEPARPKAQPPEDCASTNFATRVGVKCPGRDSNPHALTDTWPSTMPVYQFQHLGGAKEGRP